MELKENEVVWTCQPSLEGLDYGQVLREPTQVKVTRRVGGFGSLWYGHGFDHETGKVDTDTNATSIINEHTAFPTRKEANDWYETWLTAEVEDWQERLRQWKKSRKD